jgi:hypothetical protein
MSADDQDSAPPRLRPTTRGRYEVLGYGGVITTAADLEEAEVIVGLLVRCDAGDEAACKTLDDMGLEPPMVELGPPPVAGRGFGR